MTRGIYLSFILLSVLKVAVSQYGCSINEYPTQTINPCNTCDNRGWCPQDYGFACDCFPGYFRNSQGICVPPESCDAFYDAPYAAPYGTPYGSPYGKEVCGKDEEHVGCVPCGNTCETYKIREVCRPICRPGCTCRDGLVKRKDGKCVPINQCGEVYTKDSYNCGANEEFQSCGTSCPATCENPRPGSGACIQRCVTGCFCTKGYVRKNGKCVRESECKPPTAITPRNFYGQRPYRPPFRPLPPVLPPPKSAYPPVLPPPKPVFPPVLPPIKPVYPPVLPPPKSAYPPVLPPPKPAYPPPPPPPPGIKGCPNRNLCNRNCKSAGFAVGFCVGDNFLKCNCMG